MSRVLVNLSLASYMVAITRYNMHNQHSALVEESTHLDPQRCFQQVLTVDAEPASELVGCLFDAPCYDVVVIEVLVE